MAQKSNTMALTDSHPRTKQDLLCSKNSHGLGYLHFECIKVVKWQINNIWAKMGGYKIGLKENCKKVMFL